MSKINLPLVTAQGTKFVSAPDDVESSRFSLFSALPPLSISLADRFQYTKNKKIAYSVPLFHLDEKNDECLREVQMTSYIKRAFWIAYELSTFAGLEDLSDFYILTDSKTLQELQPYRELCDFPEENIIEISDMSPTWRGYIPKIIMLKYLTEQTNYRHYLHLDTSMCFPVEIDFCQQLEMHWNTSPDTFVFGANPWLPTDRFSDHFNSKNVMSLHAYRGPDSFDPGFYLEIPKFFGEECYEYYLKKVLEIPIRCVGWLHGIPRTHILSDNFNELLQFIKEKQIVFLDESVWALYWQKYLRPETRLYTSPKFIQHGTKISAGDIQIQSHPHFPADTFYMIYRGLQTTPEFHKLFINSYENLNEVK